MTVPAGAAPRGYVLPDLLRPGLRVVFCGSAAGTTSAALGAYYAGRGNRFWPTLHAVGLTPRRFLPHEYPALLDLGIGLTDLAKHASGPDAALPAGAYDRDDLAHRLRAARPGLLAFNGKRAAAAFLRVPSAALRYGEAPPPPAFPHIPPLFVLPSTSGAATAFWNPAPWFALAERVAPLQATRAPSPARGGGLGWGRDNAPHPSPKT